MFTTLKHVSDAFTSSTPVTFVQHNYSIIDLWNLIFFSGVIENLMYHNWEITKFQDGPMNPSKKVEIATTLIIPISSCFLRFWLQKWKASEVLLPSPFLADWGPLTDPPPPQLEFPGIRNYSSSNKIPEFYRSRIVRRNVEVSSLLQLENCALDSFLEIAATAETLSTEFSSGEDNDNPRRSKLKTRIIIQYSQIIRYQNV